MISSIYGFCRIYNRTTYLVRTYLVLGNRALSKKCGPSLPASQCCSRQAAFEVWPASRPQQEFTSKSHPHGFTLSLSFFTCAIGAAVQLVVSPNMTKLLLIVTGASRGLGKSIALQFCSEAALRDFSHIEIVLIARNQAQLDDTREEILRLASSKHFSALVSCHALDLGDLTELETRVEGIAKALLEDLPEIDRFERFIFVNNAGSLGHIGRAIDTLSLTEMQATVNLNVTSALWLSARMARLAEDAGKLVNRSTVVNISSLVAIQAFPSLALYSAGKAARDQYHVAMAKELGTSSSIQILNYAPGPLETDMTEEIRQSEHLDERLKPHYDKKLIDPDDSAARLVQLVLEGTFESGQHIDYFDLE